MSEAETWIATQPKQPNGKVDVALVIAEGKRRGYCICPKPMRQMINFQGLTCSLCGQPETLESHDFWYGRTG
jgi:hypothetical protein